MDNCRGPDEHETILATIGAHMQLLLIEGQHLALLGHLLADDLGPHMRLNDVRFAHVAHTEHQTGCPIPMADDRVAGEEQRLGALLWTRQFGKDNADHEGLNEYTRDALYAHGEDRLGTLLGHIAIAIADGRLRFHRVQECRHHTLHLRHAHGMRHVGNQLRLCVPQMYVLQVIVGKGDRPPDEGEEGPRDDEAGGEDEQRPAPLCVHEGREDVLPQINELLKIQYINYLASQLCNGLKQRIFNFYIQHSTFYIQRSTF